MNNSTSAGVRPATRRDADACIASLTRAFAADPVGRWCWPDEDQFFDAFPRFVPAFGGSAFAEGTAHCTDGHHGVALWFAPGFGPDDARIEQVVAETVAPETQSSLANLFEQMAGHHPDEPHWHLPLIGVAPDAQGRGLGSALLKAALTTCDRDATTAYLEATSERNLGLYRRHGFEPVGRIQAGDSPPIVPMVRRPNGAS